MVNVKDLELKIRDLINIPRKQKSLLLEPASWNKLTSSLDIIGDTELAIDAFEADYLPEAEGDKYLILYGILQALFIQQEAVQNLSEALNLSYSSDPLLNEIREIRHDSIGHPSKRQKKGKEISYNFISRTTISHSSFTLIKTFPDGKTPEFVNINLPSIINTQRDKLSKVLTILLDRLKEDEMKHRKMFGNDLLEDIFPSTIGYYFQKLNEGIYGIKKLGLIHAKLLQDIVDNFKMALEKRDILESHIQQSFDQINYPLSELKLFLEVPEKSFLNDKSAYIFSFFVEEKIRLLQELAKEIDSEYTTDL
jgi:hypothetical protein